MNTATHTPSRPSGLGEISQKLLLLSLACSALYFVTKSWQPFAGSVVLKGLCIAPLAVIAFRLLPPPNHLLLGGALAFSTLGDIFLDLQGMFVQGLGAFLIAHLIYVVLFVRNRQRPLRLSANQQISLAALLFFSLAQTMWLWPGLGQLAVPVACYIGAITLMVAAAILGRFRQSWIVWGALLFLISDSLIGINKFKTPVPGRDYLVWATYYLGQCGLALGFLREQVEQD
ncbi:MAG: lysoplasmalogenase [Acidobacteria bacterium]|nr:lysoplasmalogenase [Acidobacteriota bacterium]MBI3421330.1 lysoplasmalogenase [Acidobacteriota bacterium]